MNRIDVDNLEVGKQYQYHELFDYVVTVIDIKSRLNEPGGLRCTLRVDVCQQKPEEAGREFELMAASSYALSCHGSAFYELEAEDPGETFSFDDDEDDGREVVLQALDMHMSKISPDFYWHAEGKNMGWRKKSGYKNFEAGIAETFLNNILPNTSCSGIVTIKQDCIEMLVHHHDSPTGESYVITQGKEEDI